MEMLATRRGQDLGLVTREGSWVACSDLLGRARAGLQDCCVETAIKVTN